MPPADTGSSDITKYRFEYAELDEYKKSLKWSNQIDFPLRKGNYCSRSLNHLSNNKIFQIIFSHRRIYNHTS